MEESSTSAATYTIRLNMRIYSLPDSDRKVIISPACAYSIIHESYKESYTHRGHQYTVDAVLPESNSAQCGNIFH